MLALPLWRGRQTDGILQAAFVENIEQALRSCRIGRGQPSNRRAGMILEKSPDEIALIANSTWYLSVVGQEQTSGFDPAHT